MEQLAALYELSTAYHTCSDPDSLLRAFAEQMGQRLNASAVQVWVKTETEEGETMVSRRASWFEKGVRFGPSAEAPEGGALVEALGGGRARRVAAREADPELFEHLAETDRERVRTALYAPLQGSRDVLGAVEVLNSKSGEFTAENTALLEEAGRMTGRALETLLGTERARQADLGTFERLTSLYDISRIFNSTLELEALLPIVADKIRDILRAQACNLWLLDPEEEDLYLGHQSGEDPTTAEDERRPRGEGLIGTVAKEGEARLVEDASEEPLLEARRERQGEEFELHSVICAPLLKEEEVLGVVEVVNKLDDTSFDEDELFFLTSVSEQAAIAIHNANLLVAERKVRELDALLTISKEITSTLNLDRVLLTVVNQASTVLPFDRCSIGLYARGRLAVDAVSGLEAVPKTEEMDKLRAVQQWVAERNEVAYADKREDGWEVEPEGGVERLIPYLEEAGYRGFYALPLADEQGVLGVIALESSEEDFLQENHLELLTILASQTTVAIRNAQLYQQVPLISLMQPLLERKARLVAMPRARLLRLGVQALAVAVALTVIPWKMRISAPAQVTPADRRAITGEVEGVIRQVLVREGMTVEAGAVLAELDAGDDRVNLEQSQTHSDLARRGWMEAETRGDLGTAHQARLQMEMHQAGVELYRTRVEKARLRAPVAGVVVTPKVEEKVGELLEKGVVFCELVDARRLALEMNVPETSIDLVQSGAPVSLKLNAFPTRTFEGTVERVSAQAVSIEGEQYFVVRGLFDNPELAARTGMVGRAKITAVGGWAQSGWYPVGYVLLRGPARWFWRTAWAWWPF